MPTIRIFRHYISAAYLSLMLLESISFLTAIFVGGKLRFLFSSGWQMEPQWWITAVLFTFAMVTLNAGLGLYQRITQWSLSNLLLRLMASFALGTAVMSWLFYAFPTLFVGRGVFGFAVLFSFTAVIGVRRLFYRYVDSQRLKRRVLVLGAGDFARRILDFERRLPFGHLAFVGFVRMGYEPCRVGAERLLELNAPLRELAESQDIDEIVVAPDDRRQGLPVDEILDCKMEGVDVVDLLTFFEREAGIVKIDCLHPSWLVFSDGFRMRSSMLVKRLFDIAASLALLAVAWPVMLTTAVAIWIESRGRHPIFYRQMRVGSNWKLFQVIKFRSMRPDAERDGVRMARTGDDRVTGVGRFIRKTRIDELPQLWNVFKGDMSFVGPRPERPEFVEKFAEKIPYYAERHRVKPGITGWAQVRYPYAEDEADTVEKLQYDLYYVKNYSLFLDFLIMLQTVEVVLWGKGAR
ncbi:MAG: TIGR03013 family PEP-CTERM/XrtA system glycosyltransferase [Methylothermaceae bacterium]|nr:TIGR03013 family PEP-CTERM/XrtA system glycosyltransferase [Methylothermaceae bacterium]